MYGQGMKSGSKGVTGTHNEYRIGNAIKRGIKDPMNKNTGMTRLCFKT